MSVGDRIAAWRKHRGLSPQELAKAIGVTASAVYQWEGTGESQTTPSIQNLEALAKALGISMERFFGRVPKLQAQAS